jgi:uracil-DNA glycosylase
MNKRTELAELAAQIAEHLRYRQELGIETIGEITQPQAILPSQPANNPPLVVPGLSSVVATGTETLEQIRADLGDCQRCKLWKTRTNLVFGEGNPNAELMFVGEGPGADEDASGRPFVGRAGQLLTDMIKAIKMKREDVYIANVVKSRPPGNRAPEKEEVDACSPFLFRQIAAIHPRLIVTLGNPATQSLLRTKKGISLLRGQFHNYPQIPDIRVIPTFHPAYLLRDPSRKRETWQDLQKAQAFLEEHRSQD